MTYEEALVFIEDTCQKCKLGNCAECVNIPIKNALEMRIPKKPIVKPTRLFCPTCKKIHCSNYYHHEGFCKHCGQHIADWSDEE